MDDEIILTDENGETLTLYAVESTRVAGVNYLLAADEEGDGTCYILKDLSREEDPEAIYEMVEDPEETEDLLDIFRELVDDIDLEY